MAKSNIDPAFIRRLRYLVEFKRLSFVEVARRLGVSDTTVGRRARKLGIKPSPPTRHPELHDPDLLRGRFASGRTVADVAAELGVAYGTVVNARNRLGVSTPRAPKRPIDMAEVRRRLDAGESMGSIGRALGHSSSAISKAAKRRVKGEK